MLELGTERRASKRQAELQRRLGLQEVGGWLELGFGHVDVVRTGWRGGAGERDGPCRSGVEWKGWKST